MNLALKNVSYVYESSSELALWLSEFAPSVAVSLLLSTPQLFCEPLTSSSSISLQGLISFSVFSPNQQHFQQLQKKK